jgi:hypothetical protein
LVTRVLDTIIGIALLILVLRVVVRAFQELRSKANNPNRKRKAFALAALVVASYIWLSYFDGVVMEDQGTGEKTDALGLTTHAKDDSWLALPSHALSCSHARLVLLTGLTPLFLGSLMLFRSFRRAPTVPRISSAVAGFLAEDDLCKPLFPAGPERVEAKNVVERRIIDIWMDHAGKEEVRAAINTWSKEWKAILDPDRVRKEGSAYMEKALRSAPFAVRVDFCITRVAGYLFQEIYKEPFLQERDL